MALTSEQIGNWRSQLTNFSSVHGTRPRIVALPQAALTWTGQPETSSSTIRGGKVTALSVSQISGAAVGTVALFKLTKVGTVSNAAYGATTITGTNTITRATGSFITDGFQVNERYLLQGWTGASNPPPYYTNDIIGQPSALTATTLTVTGLVNESAVSTTATIWRLTQLGIITIAASAGAAAGTTPLNLIDRSLLPHLPAPTPSPLNSIFLGANDALALALTAACTGTQTVEVHAELGDA